MFRRNQTRKYPGDEYFKQSEQLVQTFGDQKGLSLRKRKISLYVEHTEESREEIL